MLKSRQENLCVFSLPLLIPNTLGFFPTITGSLKPTGCPTVQFFFLVVLGLPCLVQAFSGCGKWGLLFLAAVRGLLIAAASLVVEHRIQGA